jgi:hypothetical protein
MGTAWEAAEVQTKQAYETEYQISKEGLSGITNLLFSVGLSIGSEGSIQEVLMSAHC